MSRSLTVFLPIPQILLVPVEDVLLDDPGSWLPDARPEGQAVWRSVVHVGPVHREVLCHVGGVRDEPGSLWRSLSWIPAAQPNDAVPIHHVLPDFDGEIGLHRARAVLVLAGSYDVPGGRFGEFTDAIALSGVARATANRLLADISGHAAAAPAPA